MSGYRRFRWRRVRAERENRGTAGGKRTARRSFMRGLALLVWFFAVVAAHGQGANPDTGRMDPGEREGQPARMLIAYQSKYGATRQYAEWIHREIPSDLTDLDKDALPDLTRYDRIVFGSSVRIGRIVLARRIVDIWPSIRGKKLILFTSSGTPPEHPDIQKVYSRSFPEDIRAGIRYYPLRGRMIQENLTWFDRVLVAVGRYMEADPVIRQTMSADYDGVKKENLGPLLNPLRDLR